LNQNRIKRLELLSGVGAGVLGAGIALLLAKWLEPYAVPALLLGIATHGWAMFQKSRAERDAGAPQPTWTVITEWICWALLAALTTYMALRVLG
jgi:hypothetical protein